MQLPNAQKKQQLFLAFCLLLLLAATFWSFSAGLGGRFIFDDEPNLQPWRNLGDIHRLQDVLTFAASSTFFPGRPLSLLSFLIDDQSWPPDIVALKHTNLAIHLLNTCLIFWLCLKLMPRLLPHKSGVIQHWLALLAAGIWALHPLQVSNVSYVIQRMNLLSTLLELTGLLLYVHGREQLETRPWKAFFLCSIATAVMMPLAILAKENGLLLCAFALLIEGYCFSPTSWRWWPRWKMLFLWLPLIAFVIYCLVIYRGFTAHYSTRDFNSWERLLTQGPVMTEYLYKLLLPRLQGTGLYFDNFPVSRSLFDSPSTLFAWILLAGMLVLAWRTRNRMPLLSFGIFFFFCGHLMESTLLPLELYFEHRNYLPQLGLWLALCALVAKAERPAWRTFTVLAAVALVTTLAWLTRQNASLWSNSDLQAAVWYHDNPGSLRTTLSYANTLVRRHRLEEADAVLEKGKKLLPQYLNIALSQIYVRCYLQDRTTDFSELPALARRSAYETASLEMLELMWKAARANRGKKTPAGHCRPASTAEIAAIYQAILENPRFATRRVRAMLNANLGAYASTRRDLNLAMHYYDQAFANEHNPLYPFEQAVFLASAGLPDDATRYLGLARKSLNTRMRLLYPAMEANISNLEQALQQQRQQLN